MADKKVVPIRTKHKSFRSMASQAVNEDDAVRGAVVWFDEEGVMHFGQFGLQAKDIGMMTMYINMLGVEMMQMEE